jgi:hypothetical protein
MPDHVHMLISIPPKYSVAQIIGYMKGKSSIWIAQNVERKMRNFLGHKFWARVLCDDCERWSKSGLFWRHVDGRRRLTAAADCPGSQGPALL